MAMYSLEIMHFHSFSSLILFFRNRAEKTNKRVLHVLLEYFQECVIFKILTWGEEHSYRIIHGREYCFEKTAVYSLGGGRLPSEGPCTHSILILVSSPSRFQSSISSSREVSLPLWLFVLGASFLNEKCIFFVSCQSLPCPYITSSSTISKTV